MVKVPIPREHGSWAMWILPFMTAAIVTHFPAREWLLLGTVFFAYLTLAPVELLKKSTGKRKQNLVWLGLYVTLSGLFGVWLLPQYPWLLAFPLIAFLSVGVNLYFIARRAERHLLNDLSGIVALSSTFVAAYYVGTGRIDKMAILYSLYFVAFFFGSALHIKSRIRERTKPQAKYVSIAYSAALFVIFLLVDVPHLITIGQGIAWLRTMLIPLQKKPSIILIATTEVVNSLAFGVLFVFAVWPH